MSSEWATSVLSEVIEVKHGWAFKGDYMSEDADEGPIVVAIGNFDYSGGFRFSSTKIKRYSSSYPREYELQCGDILLAMTCQTPGGEILGLPGMIPSDGELYLHNQRLGKLVVKKPSRVCAQYLYWVFLSYDFNRYLAGSATGTKILHTSPSKIVSYETRIPPLEVQKDISRFLWAISDKVEINKKINQTLEQIAQALFKSWFVDFEPVKAKIAARQRWQALQPENEPASPACHADECDEPSAVGGLETTMNRAAMEAVSGKTSAQLDAMREEDPERYHGLYETAALFPSAMQASELGEIPEGWDCLALDQIAKYQNGLALQKFRPEAEDNYLPVVKISQLKKGYADGEEKASTGINPECIIDDGDVVFSWSGSLIVDTWCGGKAALNQHLFKVTSSIYPKWLYFHFTRHHLEEFQRIAADKAVTMGHIKREHLKQALCAVPNVEHMSIGKMIENMFEKQINMRLESLALTQIRDALLPKLLSGDISAANRREA